MLYPKYEAINLYGITWHQSRKKEIFKLLISSVVRIAVKFLFQMGCAAKGML
jgi:hypothetical protein